MALTDFQRDIFRLIGEQRLAAGESYVAGGVALNELLEAPRISRDIDLFHDTVSALEATWTADRSLLEKAGFEIEVQREHRAFIEALVQRGSASVIMQWVHDSAYRFFPLVAHETLGATLHPFDLATNKLLALVGRVEVRDWVDIIEAARGIQPLGYLAWAACGKDPGFSPESILEHAARSARYSADEVRELAFARDPPDAGQLSREWHEMLTQARRVVRELPPDEAGKCVLAMDGKLCRLEPSAIGAALLDNSVTFHRGRIRGAFPALVSAVEER